jgi:glutathione S-transferase
MSWLGLASAVFEPIAAAVLQGLPLTDRQQAARDLLGQRFTAALRRGPHLLGEAFTTADLAFGLLTLAPAALHSDDLTTAWIARIRTRPALARAMRRDAAG